MALLSHPVSGAEMRIVTDASDTGMGAALEQRISNSWKPMAFSSRKFTLAQRMYSTYNRELTAIFESVKYFRHFLESQNFSVVTDNKPIKYALSQNSSKASPRQQRQLTNISQFTTNIQYQPGTDNVVVDSLSRVETIRLPTEWSLIELAEAQKDDQQLQDFINNPDTSINLKKIKWGPDITTYFQRILSP